LVAQATSIKLSDKGLKLKGEVRKLRKLASEAKTTGNWANLEAEIDRLNKAYEKIKPKLSLINFISWNIKDMKDLLQPVLPVLYPNFNIILAKTARLLETSDSRPAFDNFNEVDLIKLTKTLTKTVARIKGLLTESSYENSVLEEVKEEVLNLREILTQIVKQIYTIEETKNFLVKELASKGFLEPLLQHLGNLQSQVESKIRSLEGYLSYLYKEYLSYLHEDYSPGQDTNLNERALQKPQEMVNLEIEIAELRSINEKINEKIIEFRKSTEQQNQNTNEPKTQEIEDLTKKLEKLKKIEPEMQNIIWLVHNYLEEIIQILNSDTPEDVRIWQEYIEELRRWRLNHEKAIRSQFNQFLEQHPLNPDIERIRIAELRRLIVDPDDPEALNRFREDFPSGNFVYHGTEFGRVIEILTSGYLKNVKALKETHGENVPNNSGYEGISWSFNKIKTLPGDRFHLAGLLGSPRKILDPNQQFTIPSRPSQFESIQINGDIEPNEFYDLKIQIEIYSDTPFLGEINSVFSNLARVANFESKNTMLIKFLNKHPDDQELAQELRKFYQIRTKDGQLKRFGENFNNSDSTIKLSEALLQQDEIPVAAVWIQALIDTGRVNNDPDFRGLTTVRAIVQNMPGKKDPLKEEFLKEMEYLNRLWEEQERKITPIQVPVSKLYLVVPKHDLEKYLQILARCEPSTWPKGIIVYDNRQIRLENFASLHTGDYATLSQWLQNLIPPKTPAEGYIDYCSTFLGKPEISPEDRGGYMNQVIRDSIIRKRPSIIVNNGRLIIHSGKNRAST